MKRRGRRPGPYEENPYATDGVRAAIRAMRSRRFNLRRGHTFGTPVRTRAMTDTERVEHGLPPRDVGLTEATKDSGGAS
jgi:hypothetical protein